MGSRAFKDGLYGELAVIGKALAGAYRLEFLDLLAQRPHSVEELAREVGVSIANASSHLQVLRRARLVRSEKRGTRVLYALADLEVFELWRALRDLGSARLAEIDRLVTTYLEDRSQLEPIDMADLRRRLYDDDIVIIDVRPTAEYRYGHIDGARSFPVDELESRSAELPRGREIVAYCRGPYCVFADEAVQLLLGRGFRARRLTEGFPEWRAAGYPSEMHALAS
jgi:rhodanese-related sulfurtransferase